MGSSTLRCAALALLAAASALAACKDKQIPVVEASEDRTGDYGRLALRAAVDRFRQTPTSPAAYRQLALEVEKLRPSFNKEASEEAERHLVLLALGPMSAVIDRPLEQQMAELALTVWPTAFRVEPKPAETADQYLERLCAEPLAADCKYVVPERWPIALSAHVWHRLKDRARDAYVSCRPCARDPSYAALLEKYDQHRGRVARLALAVADDTQRDAWPEAGDHASDWSGAPVLDLMSDPPRFQDQALEGRWKSALSRDRGRGATLGVHLSPRREVRHLRAALREAAAAGYAVVALQVRRKAYPYPMAEYRIATRGGPGRAVDARDVDTIQVMVRALDAAAGRVAAAHPGVAPTLRVSPR